MKASFGAHARYHNVTAGRSAPIGAPGYPTPSPSACTHVGWTVERVEQLKTLWDTGISASAIAKQLGGVTRNAVIGKVHRLGLEERSAETMRLNGRRGRSIQAAVKAKGPKPRLVHVSEPPAPGPPPVPLRQREITVADQHPAILKDLEPGQCKWPLPGQDHLQPGEMDQQLFCGAATDQAGEKVVPYCSGHMRLSVQRVAPAAPRTQPSRLRPERKRSVMRAGL